MVALSEIIKYNRQPEEYTKFKLERTRMKIKWFLKRQVRGIEDGWQLSINCQPVLDYRTSTRRKNIECIVN